MVSDTGGGKRPPIHVRPMLPVDLDAVLRIEELSFPHPWPRDQFISETARGTLSHCYVALAPCAGEGNAAAIARNAGHLAGFIMAYLVVDELHITNLAVDPAKRRCGIAAALLEASLSEAAELGANWCQLEVRVSNTPARNLYMSFGFRVLGTRKCYYLDGEDAVVMAKDLVSGI